MFGKRIIVGLSAVALMLCAGSVLAGPVSMWDFEGTTGVWGQAFGAVPDQWGSNHATASGSKEWNGPFEGGAYMRTGNWPTDRFYAPTTGFSLTEGTFMWAWRDRVDLSFAQWSDMIAMPMSLDGVNPMRFENIGGNEFTIFGGPAAGGSLDLGYEHPQLGKVTDGNWHTMAITYGNGNQVKLYIDGVLRWATTGAYDASQYTLLDHVTLANRSSTAQANCKGDYDYFMYDSQELPAVKIMQYHTDGYPVPEPASAMLVSLGGVFALRRK